MNRGELALNGLRNADLAPALIHLGPRGLTDRQLASRVSRQLGLLCAHELRAHVQRTHRYVVTKKGYTAITALLAAAQENTEDLT